jgi:hypothetical protein
MYANNLEKDYNYVPRKRAVYMNNLLFKAQRL